MILQEIKEISCGRKLMLQSNRVKIHFAPCLVPMKWSKSFFDVLFDFLYPCNKTKYLILDEKQGIKKKS